MMQSKIILLFVIVACSLAVASAELCKIIQVYQQASDWTQVDMQCPPDSGAIQYVQLWGRWDTGDVFDNKGTI